MKRFAIPAVILLTVLLVLTVPVLAEADWRDAEEALEEAPRFSFDRRFSEIVDDLTNRRFTLDGQALWRQITEELAENIREQVPILGELLAVAVILSVTERMKLVSGRCEFAVLLGGRLLTVTCLMTPVLTLVREAKESMNAISSFSSALMPPLLTTMALCGAEGSVRTLSPIVPLLSSVMTSIIVDAVFPLLLAFGSLGAVNALWPEGRLHRLAAFFESAGIWLLGILFTLFAAVISVGGMAAGVSDGISLRGIRYALSSSVPVIGGSISESFSMMLTGAYALKSAAGIAGILAVAAILLRPILRLAAWQLALKGLDGVAAPFAESFISEILNTVCRFLRLVTTALLGVSVLWFIFLGILAGAGGAAL